MSKLLKLYINNDLLETFNNLEEVKKFVHKYSIDYETIEEINTIKNLNDEFKYLHEVLQFPLFKVKSLRVSFMRYEEMIIGYLTGRIIHGKYEIKCNDGTYQYSDKIKIDRRR